LATGPIRQVEANRQQAERYPQEIRPPVFKDRRCRKTRGPEQNRPEPSVELPIAYRELAQWQARPAPNGQGNGLQGIAVDDLGNVYVADAEGRRIVVYSPDGKPLRAIEPDARHPKILQRPFGLLFVGHDRLYVADYDADQIQVFTTEGKFLFAWGREGKGRGQFRAPLGIDQDRQGNIYVVEFYGMRVQKFTPEGKFLLTWGSEAPWGKPAPPEELLYPSGLAVGPDDGGYVTDSGHDRIKVFDANGRFLREWGAKGIKPGDLNAAGGIAFDSQARLHEADAANHRIQMFTAQGRFLGEWYLPNAGKLTVWSPANLRPAGAELLYVSDVAENRIYKLAIQPGL
jgi:DNA-binding beta-propeller fold protein YncE